MWVSMHNYIYICICTICMYIGICLCMYQEYNVCAIPFQLRRLPRSTSWIVLYFCVLVGNDVI